MSRHVSMLSTGLLLCGLLLVSGMAPARSSGAGSSPADTPVQEAASGGGYRLVGGATAPDGLAVQCTVGAEAASAVQDPPADAGVVPALPMAQGDAWQTSGAASGGGYRLTGLTGDQSQGGTWQIRGGASGGSYSLDAPAAQASHVGSGCCCTYLPGLMRP